MLELIIERGMQILQTTHGEKLPRVVETLVRQFAAEPGKCQFTMYVNQPGLCRYNEHTGKITTPGGYILHKVTVTDNVPPKSEFTPQMILCQCQVTFHYDTNHKPHFANAIAN